MKYENKLAACSAHFQRKCLPHYILLGGALENKLSENWQWKKLRVNFPGDQKGRN
jgi:hypothetical protein